MAAWRHRTLIMETLWYIVVTLMLALYVVLDGFDFGVGILYPFLGRSEADRDVMRSEEHTSELQSQSNLVCRLLLEKKKKIVFRLLQLIIFRSYTLQIHIL